MFGISADTTPDVSNHDQLAVVVRCTKDMVPCERLLALKHVTVKTGLATAEEIVQVLTENTLDTCRNLFYLCEECSVICFILIVRHNP